MKPIVISFLLALGTVLSACASAPRTHEPTAAKHTAPAVERAFFLDLERAPASARCQIASTIASTSASASASDTNRMVAQGTSGQPVAAVGGEPAIAGCLESDVPVVHDAAGTPAGETRVVMPPPSVHRASPQAWDREVVW